MHLAGRSRETEWMDTAIVSDADYAGCLTDLAAVNTVTLARLPTLGFMARAVRRGGRQLRVLDVGCGGGDMLRRLRRWALRGGHRLDLVGLDLNPQGIAAARAATPAWMDIEFRCADAFAPSDERFDVVLSALFTHHLDDAAVVEFVRWMDRRATVGWFVNDLHRLPVADWAFRGLSTVAGWHRFVRHDGPVSVRRAFTRADWERVLQEAEVSADVRWHLPFRFCVGALR